MKGLGWHRRPRGAGAPGEVFVRSPLGQPSEDPAERSWAPLQVRTLKDMKDINLDLTCPACGISAPRDRPVLAVRHPARHEHMHCTGGGDLLVRLPDLADQDWKIKKK